MSSVEGTRIVKNPLEISEFLQEGFIVISECIASDSEHSCLSGTHVYTARRHHEEFIEINFPKWKSVSKNGDLVNIFCVTERSSLKRISRMLSEAIRKSRWHP